MFLQLDRIAPNRIAVVDNYNNRITYGELCEYAEEIGVHVEPRSVVFCMCKNMAGALAGYIGLVNQGAIPVMLNAKIDGKLFERLFSIYKPAYIWAPSDLIEKFQYESVFEKLDYTLLKTENTLYAVNEELELCMTTSGSTGSPKLVRYKKGNLEANAANVALAFGWTEEERSICDLQMNYTMGLNIINSHLSVGACCLLTTYNLMSGDFWKYIKEEKGTNFCGVPFSYDILKRLRFERMELPYLRTITEGGGKLTDERFRELAEYAEKNGKRFIASFGTTETSARMAVLPAEYALQKTGSIGKAIPNGELFLIDSDGKALTDPVAEGELCYKGPNVTMGYAVCKEDLNKGDEFNGVYHTGDLARRDEDGFYYITGRLSRFLKLLGYRVSLDECERLLQQEYEIECACSGTDECMKIYILDSNYEKKISDYISLKIGIYDKKLFKVIVVPEILRNESGKIRYKEMDFIYGRLQ